MSEQDVLNVLKIAEDNLNIDPDRIYLLGHSMGGAGTLHLGMKYPDVYGVIYAMSGGVMNFHKLPSTPNNIEEWEKVLRLKNLENVDWRSIRTIGLSAAFSPNPKNEPFYADFQYRLENGKLKSVPEVQNRWQQFDPVRMVDNYKNALLKLNGFRFIVVDLTALCLSIIVRWSKN